MTTTVTFTVCGAGYTVRFTYNPTLVELIKSMVPHYSRSWDPAAKQWTIDAIYAPALAAAMRRFGHTVIGIETRDRARDRQHDHRDDWARILFARVGHHRIDPVFRALTKILHPDNPATGDTALQRELIAARTELQNQGGNAA